MKLCITATAISIGLIWGVAVFLVGLANLSCPTYGRDFLGVIASIYPGYKADATLIQILVGTGYAIIDGLVGGALFAWLYNFVTKRCCGTSTDVSGGAEP